MPNLGFNPNTGKNVNSLSNILTGKGEASEVISEILSEEISNGKTEEKAIERVLERMGLQDKEIVFYGFQGILANSFSLIDKSQEQEVKLRCLALSDEIAPVFHNVWDFFKFHTEYDKPEGALKPVQFEDAMSELRMGERAKPATFEDAEVDEFDDDCTEDCIPGNHVCGKKNS